MTQPRAALCVVCVLSAVGATCVLGVRTARAQCTGDDAPLVWSSPADGAVANEHSPLLVRTVGPQLEVPTASDAKGTAIVLRYLPNLFAAGVQAGIAQVWSPELGAWPTDGPVTVTIPFVGGPQTVTFTAEPDAGPYESLALSVRGHYVGTDVESVSEECRLLTLRPRYDTCWDMPGVVHVGFDVALLASNGNASNFPASTKVRGYVVQPQGTGPFQGFQSAALAWPPECGPPRVLVRQPDFDNAQNCFRVVALVDSGSDNFKTITSEPYCLGSGGVWPAIETFRPPSEPADAGVGTGLPPGFPMFGGLGGFGGLCTPCNCPGGPMACDYINPPGSTGTGGATGAGGSTGMRASGGAGGNAEEAAAASGDDSAGCGCRLVARRASTSSNVAAAALLFGIALRAKSEFVIRDRS